MNVKFYSLSDIEPRSLVPGAQTRFVHSENMTVGFFVFDAGVQFPEHSHPHEQVTHVLEGTLLLTVSAVERKMKPGDIAVIPGNAVHSARTNEKTRVLDIFHPVREEYRT